MTLGVPANYEEFLFSAIKQFSEGTADQLLRSRRRHPWRLPARPIRDQWRFCRPGLCGYGFPGGCDCHRSEEHTSELQSLTNLVCRLLLEKKQGKLEVITHARWNPCP